MNHPDTVMFLTRVSDKIRELRDDTLFGEDENLDQNLSPEALQLFLLALAQLETAQRTMMLAVLKAEQ